MAKKPGFSKQSHATLLLHFLRRIFRNQIRVDTSFVFSPTCSYYCKKDIAQYHSSIGGTLQSHEFPPPSTGIYKLIEMLSSDTRQSHESRKWFRHQIKKKWHLKPYGVFECHFCIAWPIKIKKITMFVIFSVFSFGYFEKNIYLCIDFVTCWLSVLISDFVTCLHHPVLTHW